VSVRRADERRRLARCAGLALLVHLAAAVAIRTSVVKAVSNQWLVPIEVDTPTLEWLASVAPAPEPVTERLAALAPRAGVLGDRVEPGPGARVATRAFVAHGARSSALNAEPEVESELESGVESPLLAEEPEIDKQALTPDQLGFGLSNPFLGPARAPGPRTEPRRRNQAEAMRARLEASLRSSIVSADSRAGIGQGGPLAASLRSAFVESSLLHDNIDVVAEIAQSGQLLSLSGAGADAREIGVAIERARGSLKGKKFHIPTGATGLRVRLRVTIGIKLASGRDPKSELKVLSVPVKNGGGAGSTVEILPQPIPPDPNVVPERPGPLPPMNIVPSFGLRGDPSDIGANKRRVVQASVLSEEPL